MLIELVLRVSRKAAENEVKTHLSFHLLDLKFSGVHMLLLSQTLCIQLTNTIGQVAAGTLGALNFSLQNRLLLPQLLHGLIRFEKPARTRGSTSMDI
jgi:hypothetical protein